MHVHCTWQHGDVTENSLLPSSSTRVASLFFTLRSLTLDPSYPEPLLCSFQPPMLLSTLHCWPYLHVMLKHCIFIGIASHAWSLHFIVYCQYTRRSYIPCAPHFTPTVLMVHLFTAFYKLHNVNLQWFFVFWILTVSSYTS